MLELYTVVVYGMGKCFYPYLERLDQWVSVSYFADGSNRFVGKKVYGDTRECIHVNDIYKLKNPYVIITVDDDQAIHSIKETLDKKKIPYCHAKDLLNQKKEINSNYSIQWPEKIQRNRIHRFIDISINGTTTCNLHCEYCYVWRKEEFKKSNSLSRECDMEKLEKAFLKERLGGVCFINMCARGETLLAQDIVKFTYGLLKQGHFVSIVTNGTVTPRIKELLDFPEEMLERLFLKISFHYKELKRLGLLERFWNNIYEIRKTNCSYTLEITPGDGSVELIHEIKDMCSLKMKGALPHVSFTRDSNRVGYDLLSKYSLEEYRKIWGSFDSKMFDLKSEWYGRNMQEFQCYAGNWSYLLDLESGNIKNCYRNEVMGNIFDDSMKMFPVKPVNHDCKVSYCFNNHAFLAWGCVPEISCSTYLEMRNRTDRDGEAWVKPVMAEAMAQKLSDNNYQYMEKWGDYGKLYQTERKKAVIIFNSPDYSNLGDHAIALAERLFLSQYFHQYDVVEISCTEYMKENLRIKSAVRSDDIIAITGGGNIGTLWIRLNDLINHIIDSYKNNMILIFPQTIFFENSNYGSQEKKRFENIVTSHKNIICAVRDRESLKQIHDIGGITHVYAPDMALYLRSQYAELKGKRKSTMLICLRNDKEKVICADLDLESAARELNLIPEETSTIIQEEVTMNNRKVYMDTFVSKIATSKVVITDRLHCMIFCWLTGTPCVVFDNISGKIQGVREWIKNSPFIVEYTEEEGIYNCINKVIDRADEIDSKESIVIENSFEKLAELVRKAGNKL